MSATVVHAAGLVAVAGVFGGMAFFAFVYAPLVFIKLGAEAGGRFIREVFPVYYVTMGAMSIAAAVLLAFASAARGSDALAMACIGIVFFLARYALLPIIKGSRQNKLVLWVACVTVSFYGKRCDRNGAHEVRRAQAFS